jgi:hypothetical protein
MGCRENGGSVELGKMLVGSSSSSTIVCTLSLPGSELQASIHPLANVSYPCIDKNLEYDTYLANR